MSINRRATSSTDSKAAISFVHPHLITIPDSASSVSCPSSASSCEGSPFSFPRIVPREPGHKRRRMNTRLAVNTSKRPILPLDYEPLSPLGSQPSPIRRLNLDHSTMTVPRPPRLPTDQLARPFQPRLSSSYILSPPYILPSPSFVDTDICNQISTCIRSTENPYSVSITPDQAYRSSKSSTKSRRPGRPPNPTCPGSGASTPVPRMREEEIELNRDRNRGAEQDKWWHWATVGSSPSSVKCNDLEADDEDEIAMKCAIVCPLDGEVTHPLDKLKWRVKNGLWRPGPELNGDSARYADKIIRLCTRRLMQWETWSVVGELLRIDYQIMLSLRHVRRILASRALGVSRHRHFPQCSYPTREQK